MKRYDALVLLCVVALGYLLDHALEVRQRQHNRDDCRQQLKEIATALEMYSTDMVGRYPHSLEKLVPNYLKILPACPEAEGRRYDYQVSTMPDAFTIFCPAGHLGYSSYEGLLEHH